MDFMLSLLTYFSNWKGDGFSLVAWGLVLCVCHFRIDQSECPFTDIYADREVTEGIRCQLIYQYVNVTLQKSDKKKHKIF